MTTTIDDRAGLAATGEALYERALELARAGLRGGEAVEELVASAADASVLRHAHRLSEYEVLQRWPAPPEAIKAFFYMSAARARLDRAPGPAEGSVA